MRQTTGTQDAASRRPPRTPTVRPSTTTAVAGTLWSGLPRYCARVPVRCTVLTAGRVPVHQDLVLPAQCRPARGFPECELERGHVHPGHANCFLPQHACKRCSLRRLSSSADLMQCVLDSVMSAHNIIFDLTLCTSSSSGVDPDATLTAFVCISGGQWAGAVFNSDGCSGDCVSAYYSLLFSRGCAHVDPSGYVNSNPSAFANAFWNVAGLRVYQ
jgi:hypothetical protein